MYRDIYTSVYLYEYIHISLSLSVYKYASLCILCQQAEQSTYTYRERTEQSKYTYRERVSKYTYRERGEVGGWGRVPFSRI